MKSRPLSMLMLAAVLAAGCEASLGPSSGDAPNIPPAENAQLGPIERAEYEEAAGVLALRYVEHALPHFRNRVELPADVVASLYNALVRVHAFEHPARDTVVDVYRVRVFPNPPTREIIVGVNPTHAWVQQWKAGSRLTGNTRIDAIMNDYDLVLDRFFDMLQSDPFVTLRSPRPMNAKALAREFDGIAGVRWAEPNGFMGDGDDIRATRVGSGWRLAYSVGFGDCPAGCIGRTTWTFDVAGNGAVSYVGRSGEAPPPR